MTHDDFQTEPVRGLPERLPEGEHILWQGAPNWWRIAVEALSLYWVAGWFAFIFAWRTVGGAASETWTEAATAASFFLVLGALVCAMLMLIAYMQARATVYTVTNRRCTMRIGAALTMTLNLPFTQLEGAALSERPDGSGTIAMTMAEGGMQMSYILLWPHVRPWRMKRTEPAFRCIPDAARVARMISQAAEAELSIPQISRAPGPATVAAE